MGDRLDRSHAVAHHGSDCLLGAAMPHRVGGFNTSDGKRALRADDDAIARSVYPHDVQRIGRGHSEALTLADGEVRYALVASNDRSCEVDDLTGLERFGPPREHDAGVLPDEAKHTSWLSGFSATWRPMRSATARTSDL